MTEGAGVLPQGSLDRTVELADQFRDRPDQAALLAACAFAHAVTP